MLTEEKKKMSRRKFIYVAAGAGVAAVAGAAYLSLSAPTPTSTTTSTQTSVPATTSTSTELPAALKAIRYDEVQWTAEKGLYNQWENATGNTIDFEIYDEPTSRQKMVLDFSSHTKLYDVVIQQYWFLPEYAEAGYVKPLDDLIKNNPSKWLNLDDLAPGARAALQYKGQTYALPEYMNSHLLYMRKDILDENGWNKPNTIDEMISTIEAFYELKKQGKYPDVSGFGARGRRDFDVFNAFAGFAYAYGATLFDQNGNLTLLSDPRWKESISTWVHLLKDYGPTGVSSWSWPELIPAFDQGKLLFFSDVNDIGAYYETIKPEQVDYQAKLQGPSDDYVQWFFTEGWAISNDISAEKLNAAWSWLQWTGSYDFQVEAAKTIPVEVNLKALASPEYTDAWKAKGLERYAAAAVESMKVAVDPKLYSPANPNWVKISETFATEVSAAIDGLQSVDTTLKNANDKILEIMQKSG
jgi:ABC-type glycerol-3-phosphate transport system substrate-binding protein